MTQDLAHDGRLQPLEPRVSFRVFAGQRGCPGWDSNPHALAGRGVYVMDSAVKPYRFVRMIPSDQGKQSGASRRPRPIRSRSGESCARFVHGERTHEAHSGRTSIRTSPSTIRSTEGAPDQHGAAAEVDDIAPADPARPLPRPRPQRPTQRAAPHRFSTSTQRIRSSATSRPLLEAPDAQHRLRSRHRALDPRQCGYRAAGGQCCPGPRPPGEVG